MRHLFFLTMVSLSFWGGTFSAHSQLSGELFGGIGKAALSKWIQKSEAEAIRAGVNPIPEHIKRELRKCKDFYLEGRMEELLNRAYYRQGRGSFKSIQTHAFYMEGRPAIVLDKVIVFRHSGDLDNIHLWAHELKHVEQFWLEGTRGFAERYIEDGVNYGYKWGIEYEAESTANLCISRINAIRNHEAHEAYLKRVEEGRKVFEKKARDFAKFGVSGYWTYSWNGEETGIIRAVNTKTNRIYGSGFFNHAGSSNWKIVGLGKFRTDEAIEFVFAAGGPGDSFEITKNKLRKFYPDNTEMHSTFRRSGILRQTSEDVFSGQLDTAEGKYKPVEIVLRVCDPCTAELKKYQKIPDVF